jgi:dTDP-4-amino-4,6-dideoxygalactose transaminase
MKYCLGAPGCTQAIFTAMMAMEFEPGDEIVISPIADYGTVAGALFQNFVPVFADAEPGTGLVSAAAIEPCITSRTRAIIVVHLFGLPCDMDPIVALARKRNLILIEDVCQAILSTYKGRLAGTFGDLSCFSFDAEKTCGADMGGAVLTNDKAIYDRLVNRGPARGGVMEPGFGRVHTYRGFPTRIPQCTAATVLANFEILPRQVAQRQKTAALMDAMLGRIPGVIPYPVPEGRTHTRWMYGFSLQADRFRCAPEEFARQLGDAGIPDVGLGKYYLTPAALRFMTESARAGRYPFCAPPASRVPDYSVGSVPNAHKFLETWVRWFWTEKFTEAHVERMAQIIQDTAKKNRR